MKKTQIFICILVLCLVQMLLNNFLNINYLLSLSLLPLAILCLPRDFPGIAALIVAFAAGLLCDFASTGNLGLESCALMPLALLRSPLLSFFGTEEGLGSKEGCPLSGMSSGRVFLLLLAGCLIFYAVFVWVDAAGTRSFAFNLLRFGLSGLASAVLCFICHLVLFREH